MRDLNPKRDISASNPITICLKKACGSEASIREYLSKWRMFFNWAGIEPDRLVAAWKAVKYDLRLREEFVDEWTEKIEAYIYSSQCDSYAPLTKRNTVAIIKSFFKHNRIPVSPEYEKHAYVKYHNRDIKREEIRRILEHSTLRDKTFFLMMVESGLRPETLVQLRYRHIKKDFEANRVPMTIDLPSELLKDRVEPRWTFIGEDGFNALKEYLKLRLPLENEDLIFQPRRAGMTHKYLSPSSFTNIFRRTAMKLGIVETIERGKPKPIRLYCLRKFFNNNCRYEGFEPAYKEYWMAHETTQTHYISRDPEVHRQEYKKAYENLRIYKTEPSTIELRELLAQRDKELAQLRQRLEILTPLVKLIEEKPKAFEGLLNKEQQRLLRITVKWSRRAGIL